MDKVKNSLKILGVLNYINGDKYDGDWTDDKKGPNGRMNFNGVGMQFYANGDKYDGQWENEVVQGKGKVEI